MHVLISFNILGESSNTTLIEISIVQLKILEHISVYEGFVYESSSFSFRFFMAKYIQCFKFNIQLARNRNFVFDTEISLLKKGWLNDKSHMRL